MKDFDMKALEGKEVYLKPTGNRDSYDKGKISKGVIVKVARVFVTLTFEGSTYEWKYRFSGNRLNDSHNGGYIVFPDKQAIDDYEEVRLLAETITDKYTYQRDYYDVELEKLRKVAELLDVS